jgi:hypothetical protein
MIEATSGLDIAGKWWVKMLFSWGNPVDDDTFQTLGVI